MDGIIGNRIKELRQKRGMTQEELGRHLGVNKAAVQKYESGQTSLTAEKIRILCTVLHAAPRVFIFPDEGDFVNTILMATRFVGEDIFVNNIVNRQGIEYLHTEIYRLAYSLNYDGAKKLYEHAKLLSMIPALIKDP